MILSTFVSVVLSALVPFIVVEGANNDLWNYGYTTYNDGRLSYGQPNWNAITCEDPLTCVSLQQNVFVVECLSFHIVSLIHSSHCIYSDWILGKVSIYSL